VAETVSKARASRAEGFIGVRLKMEDGG